MRHLYKDRLLSSAKALIRDQNGNFAITAALSLTAVLGAVGAAIDMSGLVSERSRLQNITDSAVLAASGSGNTKEVDLKAVVDDMMAVHHDGIRDFEYTMSIVDKDIVVSARAEHETAIMSMFGYKTFPISTESGAPLPADVPIQVSLVVDTTDSMAGANLASLQNAADVLIKIVEKNKTAGAKMTVVPFGNYVNVGMGNRSESWMDVPADFTETPACYMHKPVKSVTGCTTVTQTGYSDGVPYDYEGTEGCTYEYEDFEVEYCPAPRDVEWKGCAGSRNEPLNIIAAANGSSEIPGAMGVSCGSELLPLTDDFGDVKDVIDGLTTRGSTYLPTGLIWGWRSLSPESPYANAEASDNTVRAMIFMTDGGNTMSQYDKDGSGDEAYHRTISADDKSENAKAAERMLAICDGIKGDGITVFTVGYKLSAGAVGDGADLEACASSSSTAFSADNSKELEAAFKNIGKALSSVRLTF